MPASPGKAARIADGAAVMVAAATFIFLAWSSTRNLGTLWDEQVDIDIARSLRASPWFGETPPQDASQTRLPMYATALVFAITGRDDLATARGVSIVAAAAGIIVTAALARRLFGRATAVLTALLLAVAPYYLAFGRIAMTEGDAFLALTIPAACLAFLRFVDRPGTGRWLVAGICLGLAIGAKAHAGLIVLPLWLYLRTAWRPLNSRTQNVEIPKKAASDPRVRRLWNWVLISAAAGAIGWLAAWGGRVPAFAAWSAVVLCGIATALAVRGVDVTKLGAFRAMLGLLVVACIVWVGIMPVHITQRGIVLELLRRACRWDHRIPLALWADHLRLYSGIVLIKATLPIGVLSAMGVLAAGWLEARDVRWRLPVLVIAFWLALLCFLPLRQTFYLMGIYPLLMLLTAAWMVELATLLGRGGMARRGAAWLAVVVLPFVWLTGRSLAARPEFALFGYDIVGNRWLGAESRGYRNLIQTNSDGVDQAARWCVDHVPPGKKVVSFLWEDHLLDRILPQNLPFTFVRRGILPTSDALPAAPSIHDADYVLIHINNLLGYGDRPPDAPPMDEIRRLFSPVFRVCRGRDEIEVAWVYQRNPSATRPARQPPIDAGSSKIIENPRKNS